MTRVRLRPAYPDPTAFYVYRYPSGYQHTQWPDHVERVRATVDFVRPHLDHFLIESMADLSCGDGAIARGIIQHRSTSATTRIRRAVLGDLNLDYRLVTASRENPVESWPSTIQFLHGPAEAMLERLDPPVDLFVCSETLEHLDDPDAFLTEVRKRARYLLITTPDGESDPAMNPEHYWGWGTYDVSQMLHHTGWSVVDHILFSPANPSPYLFQMWLVR